MSRPSSSKREDPPPWPSSTPLQPSRSRPRANTLTSPATPEDRRRRPSIRLRRPLSYQSIVRGAGNTDERPGSGPGPIAHHASANDLRRLNAAAAPTTRPRAGTSSHAVIYERPSMDGAEVEGNRRRSSSDPLRLNRPAAPSGSLRNPPYMPEVQEDGVFSGAGGTLPQNLAVPVGGNLVRARSRVSSIAGSMLRFPSYNNNNANVSDNVGDPEQFDEHLVDVLDTVDPEVSTLSTLTNVQNSLFIPDFGRYVNRRPTFTLTRLGEAERPPGAEPPPPEGPTADELEGLDEEQRSALRRQRLTSITSRLDADHFAVLPHGEQLQGWSQEDIAELNDHVRHMLHSRREKFKRSMKGFGQYVRKPLGFCVTLYATLITLFGLAWVLFLIGWINVGGRKDYIVNVIDNVLVALFAIMGDGLAPFRAVDTYHMVFIAHYHHLTWRLRKEQALPKLKDQNSLPDLHVTQPDLEEGQKAQGTPYTEKEEEISVLTPTQQKKVEHHQKKFSRSHTYYKPHETTTHFAFPLRLLVAITVLLDCHSLLQIALGTCTWAISYKVRPFALTTVILCCSITCNITAGVLISVGDHKTRKKDVLERMSRQDLTEQAMKHMVKRKKKEGLNNQDLEQGVDPVEGPVIPPMKKEGGDIDEL